MKELKSLLLLAFVASLVLVVGCNPFESKDTKNAKSCIGIERHDKVLASTETEIKKKPDSDVAEVMRKCYTLGMFKEAIRLGDSTLITDPLNYEIQLQLWVSKDGAGYGGKSFAHFTNALNICSLNKEESVKDCLRRGVRLVKADRMRLARAEFLLARNIFKERPNKKIGKLFYDAAVKITGSEEEIELLEEAFSYDNKYAEAFSRELVKIFLLPKNAHRKVEDLKIACEIHASACEEYEKAVREAAVK